MFNPTINSKEIFVWLLCANLYFKAISFHFFFQLVFFVLCFSFSQLVCACCLLCVCFFLFFSFLFFRLGLRMCWLSAVYFFISLLQPNLCVFVCAGLHFWVQCDALRGFYGHFIFGPTLTCGFCGKNMKMTRNLNIFTKVLNVGHQRHFRKTKAPESGPGVLLLLLIATFELFHRHTTLIHLIDKSKKTVNEKNC